VRVPPPGNEDFLIFPEPLSLVFDKSLGRAPPYVWQFHGSWLVSDGMMAVLE